jgi:hypothetical protein
VQRSIGRHTQTGTACRSSLLQKPNFSWTSSFVSGICGGVLWLLQVVAETAQALAAAGASGPCHRAAVRVGFHMGLPLQVRPSWQAPSATAEYSSRPAAAIRLPLHLSGPHRQRQLDTGTVAVCMSPPVTHARV